MTINMRNDASCTLIKGVTSTDERKDILDDEKVE